MAALAVDGTDGPWRPAKADDVVAAYCRDVLRCRCRRALLAEWSRFDGSTTEYVYRLLTDPTVPHSAARYFDTHWFQSCAD
ncbi:hypothetical protein NRF20_04735 [Streptomyces sp. R-74717]|uniref:hypothetical protein n=1 Tax=Streptomyces TaxID=1883 RepID=UPI0037AA210E